MNTIWIKSCFYKPFEKFILNFYFYTSNHLRGKVVFRKLKFYTVSLCRYSIYWMCFLFLAKCKGATPLKILNIGNVSTPLMCLSESVNLTEKNIMWGGCGTKVFSFSDDFTIQKLIETRTNQRWVIPFCAANLPFY